MSDDQIAQQSISNPKLQARMLTNWSEGDLILVGISLLAIAATWIWIGVLGSLVILIIVASLMIRFPNSYGRLYQEFGNSVKSIRYDSKKGKVWEGEFDADGNRRPNVKPSNPFPFEFTEIQATIEGKLDRYCLLQETDRRYDQLYIVGEGGNFAAMDVNQQLSAVNTLANVANLVILRSKSDVKLKTGISFLRVNGPYDPTEVVTNVQKGINPILALPDRFEVDEKTAEWYDWARRNSNQFRPMASAYGASKSWSLIVVTIKRPRNWRAARRGKLSPEQLYDFPIVELGRAMVDNLSANSMLGLKNVRCLGLAELASLVRATWDVGPSLEKYYKDKDLGLIPKTDEEIDAFRELHAGEKDLGEKVLAYLQALPTDSIYSYDAKDCLVIDGNWISTLRVESMPSVVRSDQFMKLQYIDGPGQWARRAMVGQSLSGKTETRQLIFAQSALMNFQSAFFGSRLVQNPNYTRRQRGLSQQTWDISANSVAQQFLYLIPIVATSESKMKQHVKDTSGRLGAASFGNKVVPSSGRQLDAFLSSLGMNRL